MGQVSINQASDQKGSSNSSKWTFSCLIGGVLFCLLVVGGWQIYSSLKPCKSLDLLFNRSGCEGITQLRDTEILVLSKDGSVLAAYIDLNSMEILNLKTEELKTITGSDAEIWAGAGEYSIALTSDGRYAAVIGIGSPTGEPQLGLVETTLAQPVLQAIPLPAGQLATRAAFSPDDLTLAVAIDAKQDYVALFHVSDGKQIGRLDFSGENIAVVYTPNGRLMTAIDGQIQIWDVDKKSIEKTIGSQLPPIYSIVPSADGSLIAISSGDRYGFGTMAVDVIRLDDGKGLYKFAAKANLIAFNGFPAAFSPDGKLLAVSSCDVAEVYSLTDGELVTTFLRHWDNRPLGGVGKCLSGVQFTPDGKSVYYGWTDGGVIKWHLP